VSHRIGRAERDTTYSHGYPQEARLVTLPGVRRSIVADVEGLTERFREFAGSAAEFSHEMADLFIPNTHDRLNLVASNLEIAKTVFGKWCIEIFIVLYNVGPLGFADLRRNLGGMSPRVLSRKLKMMEGRRLVQRTLIDSRPPGVRYALTDRGVTVARLGTPVFLFFSLEEQPH
jgi:DNA-binding HxlR family transcriptional regulator